MNCNGRILKHSKFACGKFKRLYTFADGSCFFHSVAMALNLDNCMQKTGNAKREVGLELRKKICSTYANYVASLDDDIRLAVDKEGKCIIQSIDDACNPRVSAGEELWRLTSKFLCITIVVCESPGKSYITPDIKSDQPDKTIILAWINRNHFEPIIMIDKSGNSQGVFTKHSRIVKAIRRRS